MLKHKFPIVIRIAIKYRLFKLIFSQYPEAQRHLVFLQDIQTMFESSPLFCHKSDREDIKSTGGR